MSVKGCSQQSIEVIIKAQERRQGPVPKTLLVPGKMMNTFKCALVSVLWPAMVVSAQIASVKAYSAPDAAEVYRGLFALRGKKPVLVLSTTVGPKACSVSEKDAKAIKDPQFREAMDAFRDVNERLWDLSSVLGDRKTISEAELDEIFKRA